MNTSPSAHVKMYKKMFKLKIRHTEISSRQGHHHNDYYYIAKYNKHQNIFYFNTDGANIWEGDLVN